MQDDISCTSTKQAIAGAVRATMARRKISQKALRTDLGWSVSFLGRRLSGEVELTVSELFAIAGALHADPADIISNALQDAGRAVAA